MRSDALRNRLRILEAAETVFAEGGTAAPIDDVAARAGVGVGTVYRHFPTKRALLEAIVRHHVDEIVDATDGAEGDPEAFFRFVERMVSVAGSHRELAEELALFGECGEEALAFKADLTERLDRRLACLLATAQTSGAVRADVTVEDVHALIGGTCVVAGSGGSSPERLAAIIADGLRGGPPRGAAPTG